MARAPAALALIAVLAAGALLVSGGSSSDPRTPAALPGLPAPFLGTAVLGDGALTAAVDSYGGVVDLRRAPAGPALIEIPAGRQAAGTVPATAGIVPRLDPGQGEALPFWRADAVAQRYRPGTDVLVTTARFGQVRARVTYAVRGRRLACVTAVWEVRGAAGRPGLVTLTARSAPAARLLRCDDRWARAAIDDAVREDRRWLGASAALGAAAPGWAEAMYRRSLLVLRALADRRSGAVAAGARDGWAYVGPRDAAAAALAFAAAGRVREARRAARFLAGLDLTAAARFHGDGSPVPGRAPQGDAAGWVAVAAVAAGPAAQGIGRRAAPAPGTGPPDDPPGWRSHADYQEKAPGDYLGNAIAATAGGAPPSAAAITARFATSAGLVRAAGDPTSGVDSAAAWAVRPFPLPRLFAAVRESLRRLLAGGGRFGIVPSAGWPEDDPWTAPTAWSAWAFAALAQAGARGEGPASPRARADRRAALALLADLRRAATPAGTLPERVDAHTGVPRSTTPLAWSHAFAVLALRELWPRR